MTLRSAAFVLAVLLMAAPAVASEHATTTSAWGDLDRTSWSGSAHSPGIYVGWHHAIEDGLTYSVVTDTISWSWVLDDVFTLHCDEETLAYTGSWGEIDPYHFFHYLFLDVELGCTLDVTGPVRLTMTRELVLPIMPGGHWVELTHPDGSTVTFLGPEEPENTVELTLSPGAHTLRLLVDVGYADLDDLDVQPPYAAAVTISWEDVDVAVEGATWSGVKRLFR